MAQVVSFLLGLTMLTGSAGPSTTPSGVPVTGVATWYGSTAPKGEKYCVGGYKNTCSPYKSKAAGGRGGELVMYAAVGRWRWGAKPFRLRVCRKDNATKCVIVVVRDYCGSCREGLNKPWTSKSRAIDLSPTAFSRLAPLGRGVLAVTITELPKSRESFNRLVPRGR